MELEAALLGPAGFFVAFLVGTVSFFSPCVLPLLPGYLSYVSGVSGEQAAAPKRHRVFFATLLFVAGFATIFTALGATATALGDVLLQHLPALTRIAGAIVIVIGVSILMPSLLPFMEREKRPFFSRVKPGMASAFPLGMAFAFGWTPCVGPGLGVMLTLAAPGGGSPLRGALLLFFFSFGFGIWFLLASLGAERILRGGWFSRHVRHIQLVGGVMMVTIGVLLVTDLWYQVMSPILRWSSSFVPAI